MADRQRGKVLCILSQIVLLAFVEGVAQAAIPNEISVQGTLEASGGGPLSGVRDYRVRFFESGTGGSSIGEVLGTVSLSTGGRFSIDLVPPEAALDAAEAWYELAIDAAADGIDPNDIFPNRVRILSVPFALHSADAQTLGETPAEDYSTDAELSAGLAGKADSAHSHDADYWSVDGNAGMSGKFLGTTDMEALEIHVNGARALRIEPGNSIPNLIGGAETNEATPGISASVIGGGVSNQVTGSFCTVSGGAYNIAAKSYSTVGGGGGNLARGNSATVAGGSDNTAEQQCSTAVGGQGNRAVAQYSMVGGGYLNSASGEYSTVGGGETNLAEGEYSTVSGGTTNTAAASHSTVGGGDENTAGGTWSTVGGGTTNSAVGSRSTVGGGDENTAEGMWSTVAGGRFNDAIGDSSIIAGGRNNRATGEYSVVCGGHVNQCPADYATIGGGHHNFSRGFASTVPGGIYNTASGLTSLAAGYNADARHDGAFVWADHDNQVFYSTGGNQFLIRASGGVGIGTNSPRNQLHVKRDISAGAGIENHVAAIENTSTGESPDVLALKLNIATPTDANNYITFMNDTGNIGAIEGNGSGGITVNTSSGDFAEYLPLLDPSEDRSAPADIVGLFCRGVSRKTEGAQRVFVVSSSPIVLGNQPKQGREEDFAPVAFLGQVPVKVRGPVNAGDYIVPSGSGDGVGVGMRPGEMTLEQCAHVIGRSLESSQEQGIKQITVLVGLPDKHMWASLLRARDDRIEELETRLSAIENLLNMSRKGRVSQID